MKSAFAVLLLSAGTAGVVEPDIFELLRDAYPADRAKQTALEWCASEDKNFNRLSTAEREACYQRMVPSAAISAVAASALQAAPNPIDMAQSAGARQGDIRQQQATERYRSAVSH